MWVKNGDLERGLGWTALENLRNTRCQSYLNWFAFFVPYVPGCIWNSYQCQLVKTVDSEIFSSVQSLSCRLFATPWTAACQASLSINISLSLLKLVSIESVMPSNHLILCHPSSPQSFPASGSFPMSSLFVSGGQSIDASASVLPMNIQDWFPLRLTGLISLLFKGLSRVFNNTIESISSAVRLLYGPTLTSIHDYWKKYSFDYTDLC